MPEYKLAPSILAADFANLGQQVEVITKAGAEYVHIDVMDGVFVPTISFGVPIIEGIRKCTTNFFDVHLMVDDPIRHIENFATAGADGITVHVEACRDLKKTLKWMREFDVKPAVSICPNTPLESIIDILDQVSMVLVMTVQPGFGGQKFIECSYERIRRLHTIIQEKNLKVDIEVDGGVTLLNVSHVIEAGANIIVAGTAVYRGDINENIKAFQKAFSIHSNRMCLNNRQEGT